MKIGIVGQGFVGTAVKEGLEKLKVNSLDSLVDDKKIKTTNTPNNI